MCHTPNARGDSRLRDLLAYEVSRMLTSGVQPQIVDVDNAEVSGRVRRFSRSPVGELEGLPCDPRPRGAAYLLRRDVHVLVRETWSSASRDKLTTLAINNGSQIEQTADCRCETVT